MVRTHNSITFIVVLSLLLGFFSPAEASIWESLWARPDEQAAKLLAKGNPKRAAQRFKDRSWQGVANYRSGAYPEAVDNFSEKDTAASYYNRGNALAHLGQYEKSIEAYDAALKEEPDNADAKYNRDLLKKLLEQQKQKQGRAKTRDDKQQQANKQVGQGQEGGDQDKQGQPQPKEVQSNKENADQKEQREAKQQWLRRIPDNPGGLLRHKFLRDHLKLKENKG